MGKTVFWTDGFRGCHLNRWKPAFAFTSCLGFTTNTPTGSEIHKENHWRRVVVVLFFTPVERDLCSLIRNWMMKVSINKKDHGISIKLCHLGVSIFMEDLQPPDASSVVYNGKSINGWFRDTPIGWKPPLLVGNIVHTAPRWKRLQKSYATIYSMCLGTTIRHYSFLGGVYIHAYT